jgi:hypothetical protein
VLKLHKALYGLREAPRAWYSKLHLSLNSLGFTRNDQEHAVYTRRTASRPLAVSVYVDDLLIAGLVSEDIDMFKLEMRECFRMSDLGLVTYYLGIKVRQDEAGISLCQSAYALKIHEKTDMQECNSYLNYSDEGSALTDQGKFSGIGECHEVQKCGGSTVVLDSHKTGFSSCCELHE